MEEQCNIKWKELLKIFHAIKIDATNSKEKYEQLIELAKQDVDMTPRQKEGIIDRCNNCINGTYGKSKNSANLEYGASPITKEQSNGKP